MWPIEVVLSLACIGGTILRLKPGIISGASYSHKHDCNAFVGLTADVERYSMAAHTSNLNKSTAAVAVGNGKSR